MKTKRITIGIIITLIGILTGMIFGAGIYKQKVDDNSTHPDKTVSKEVFDIFAEKNEGEHQRIFGTLDKIDGKIDTLIMYQLNKELDTTIKIVKE